jgi:two-component system nitrate/nitrite response regulator NarL
MTTVNIFLVDPHRLLREGIKSLLQNTPFRVGGESGEWQDAILEQGAEVDLILLELPSDPEKALALLREMRRAGPNAKLVVLTANFDSWLLANAADLGICGLLPKDISPLALLHSLDLVMLCEKVFPIHQTFLPMTPEHDKLPLRGAETNSFEQAFEVADLSVREIEILRYLTSGLPNKVIARELNVAETTIKAHVKTILRKIKAGNRTQAAIWCLTKGLGSPGPTNSIGDRRKNGSPPATFSESEQWYRGAQRSAKQSFVVEAVASAGATGDGTSV